MATWVELDPQLTLSLRFDVNDKKCSNLMFLLKQLNCNFEANFNCAIEVPMYIIIISIPYERSHDIIKAIDTCLEMDPTRWMEQIGCKFIQEAKEGEIYNEKQ